MIADHSARLDGTGAAVFVGAKNAYDPQPYDAVWVHRAADGSVAFWVTKPDGTTRAEVRFFSPAARALGAFLAGDAP